jgi:hypothetical protein
MDLVKQILKVYDIRSPFFVSEKVEIFLKNLELVVQVFTKSQTFSWNSKFDFWYFRTGLCIFNGFFLKFWRCPRSIVHKIVISNN